jgi:hypothetical protein
MRPDQSPLSQLIPRWPQDPEKIHEHKNIRNMMQQIGAVAQLKMKGHEKL